LVTRRVQAYAVLKKADFQSYIKRPITGVDAALAEYNEFKRRGMLDVWWERWKFVLRPPGLW